MGDFFLNRIRILKTGLADVQRYIDMSGSGNRAFFEKLAEPGTQLKLKRVYDDKRDPFRIEVYSPDDRYLGRVTVGKGETAARLMDAGLKVIAVVNRSQPLHDSDLNEDFTAEDPRAFGWSEASREETDYDSCNLPYCLYLVDD